MKLKTSTFASILCAVIIISLVTTGAAAAQSESVDVQGSPDLDAFLPDNEVVPGEETTITVQLSSDGNVNRGTPANREVVTTARSTTAQLSGAGTPIRVTTAQQNVGSVRESDPTAVEFDIKVPTNAQSGTYKLDVDLAYTYISKANNRPTQRATQNTETRSTTESIRVRVTDDPRFAVSEIDSTLRVGEEGEITGQLRNIGADDARSVEVRFAPESDTVIATTNRVAVDNIPAGESAQFSIPVEVTTEAEAVPREFDLPVSYRNADTGIRGEDDDPSFRVDIAESRDTLIIEPVNPTVAAGSTKSLDLRVTNNRDETLEDIEGKLFVDDPLDSANDETFTTALEPNETTTVTVDLSASEGATIKNYPVSMDFRYTDSDGDSKLTDSYRLSIDVTEPSDDGGGLPLGPLLIGLVVVAGAGGVLWRRQNSDTTDLSGLDNE